MALIQIASLNTVLTRNHFSTVDKIRHKPFTRVTQKFLCNNNMPICIAKKV